MTSHDSEPVSDAEASALFDDLTSLPALVLAVSGGPDSTALMLLAARWRAALKRGPTLVAVTVDHGLRSESHGEAKAVAKLARLLGIAHRTLNWTGLKPKTGLPQAARAARYRLLAQAARKAGAPAILTAHTLDDQAETVLIRMSRGSGLTGLAAMARVSALPYPSPEKGGWSVRSTDRMGSALKVLDGMTATRRAAHADLPLAGGGMKNAKAPLLLIRPFLTIPKSRLIATLKAAHVRFADDPTNRDPRFTRARLRGLMPRLTEEGLDAPRLALLARRLARAEVALSAATDRAFDELTAKPARTGEIAFDRPGFAALSPEIALRLIGRAVDATGNEGPVELGKLEALGAALTEAMQAGAQARFRRSLAGALVSVTPRTVAVARAPARRSRTLTKGTAAPRRGPKPR